MQQYLDIIRQILINGELKENRTGIRCLTDFHLQLSHDMADGFPLLTTRRIPLKSVAIELEGFLKGICSKKWYLDRGCPYWKQWCNPTKILGKMNAGLSTCSTPEEIQQLRYKIQEEEDDLGPFYAHQIRRFNQVYDENDDGCINGVDQLADIVNKLKTDPNDRRMVCLNHNPIQAHKAALSACHVAWIVSHLNGKLHMSWYQRSCDLMLGVASNLASYSLLLLLLCKETGFKPGKVTGTLVDCHIYENHIPQAKEQLSRNIYKLPTVEIPDTIILDDGTEKPFSIFDWTHKNYNLYDYTHWPSIKMDVAV